MKGFVKSNLAIISAVIVGLGYIALAIVFIGKTGKEINQILAEGAMAYIFSFVITSLLAKQGVIMGENDERYRNTVTAHTKAVEEVDANINLLDDWCEIKNKEALRIARRDMLYSEGLKYTDFFNSDGSVKETSIKRKKGFLNFFKWLKEIKVLNAAIRIKITRLNTSMLTSHGKGKPYDPNFLGETLSEHTSKGTKQNAISKILFGVVFGYFGIGLLENFSWENFVWMTMQAISFFGWGIISLLSEKSYVTNDLRSRMVKQIDLLKEFSADVKAGRIKASPSLIKSKTEEIEETGNIVSTPQSDVQASKENEDGGQSV